MVSLESRRYELFRRLDDKLLLESGEARGFPPLVSREIVAVIDATDLLLDQVVERNSVDLDVTAGAFIATHTVPVGERWRLVSMNREATNTATNVQVNYAVPSLSHQVSTNQVAFDIIDVKGLKLQAGDRIGMISTDDVADGAIFLQVIFDRELVGLAQ